jgi:hypothetical protein
LRALSFIGLGATLIGIELVYQRVLSKPDFYDREPEGENVKKIDNMAKAIWSVVAVYILLNLIIFGLNPYARVWHYQNHGPLPVPISEPEDEDLSLDQLVLILDEIDLDYGSREPNQLEKANMERLSVMSMVFQPATIALKMKAFVGYMGPPTEQQQAFTLSVKERYNHLARLAIDKGYNDNGFLYQIEPSLSKRDGVAFADIYRYGPASAGEVDGASLQQTLGNEDCISGAIKKRHASDSSDSSLRSIVGDTKASIKFVNDSGMAVEIYWKNYQGDEILYQTLQSGASYMQQTFVTHPWIVRDQCGGEVLLTIIAAAGARVASVKAP